jgi:hypothetical protein
MTPDTRPDFLAAALLGYQEMLKQIESGIAELRKKLKVTGKTGSLSVAGGAPVFIALKKRSTDAPKAKPAASQPTQKPATAAVAKRVTGQPAPKPAVKHAMAPKAARRRTRATQKVRARAVKRAAVPQRATQKETPIKTAALEAVVSESVQVPPVAVEQIALTATVAVEPISKAPAPIGQAATA